MRRNVPLIGRLLLALYLVGSGGCGDETSSPVEHVPADASAASRSVEAPRFVGSAACGECHGEIAARFTGSDHDRAMDLSIEGSVLGRFDGRELVLEGESWRFEREGEDFVVLHTADEDAIARRFRVEATFGRFPLQQLLVRSEGGRFQALPVAWDAREREAGGERWFSLHPGESIPPGDPLHWEGLAYNWNTQCAACHSTALEKGFDDASNTFDTTSAEIDVACEACHGPGSRHVDHPGGEARRPSLPVEFEPFTGAVWRRDANARIATRREVRTQDRQMDVCAPCHSRRSELTAAPSIGEPFLDQYAPRLLDPALYFDDGQMRDEVYVYGSFSQSRMYASGVRCSDCHEPHSLGLRREGDALCGGCHAPEAYGSAAHRGHAEVSEGAPGCVDCHMPERTYMEIDRRRDHAFILPRPSRSAALESPDACAACHARESPSRLQAAIDRWRGNRPVAPHWSDALVRGGEQRTEASRWLDVVSDPRATDWIRGGAWSRFAQEAPVAPAFERLAERIEKGGPLERLGLIEVVRRLDAGVQVALLRSLLEDPREAVRVSAAEALSAVPSALLSPADRAALGRGLRAYRAAQEAMAERPEAQVNLGVLAARYGDLDQARRAYGKSIDRAPYFIPAHVNLADLERAAGNEAKSVAHLRDALALRPEDAHVRYALGLALHRAGETRLALSELRRAAKDAPEDSRITLAYALSLDGEGEHASAIEVLEHFVSEGGAEPDVHQALVALLRDDGRLEAARARARDWQRAHPGDGRAAGMLDALGAGSRGVGRERSR